MHDILNPVAPALASERGKLWRTGTLTYTTTGLAVLFFWLLWGDFAWQMKERSVPYVMQLLFKKFDASDTIAGLLIGSLPQAVGLILGPIIAYKSDRHRGRWGRRIPFLIIPTPIIVISMMGLAYSPVLGGMMNHALGPNSPGLNSVILILLGLFWTLFEFSSIIASSVFYGLVNDVVPVAVIGRFFGFFRAFSLMAGVLFTYWLMGKAEAHYVWIFFGMAALYGIGLTMMGLKVREGEYPPPAPAGPERGIVGFLQAAKTFAMECFCIPYYWWFYASIALSWMAFMPVNLFSIFFAKSLAMDMTFYGKCMALTFCISFALSFPLGYLADRFHPLRLGLMVQAVYALLTFCGGFIVHDSTSFAILLIMHGVVSGAWMTVTASLANRLLPNSRFAQYGSAAGIFSGLCAIMVGPVVGMFLDYVHHIYRYTYFMTSGIELLALFCGFVLYRKFLALGGHKNYAPPV